MIETRELKLQHIHVTFDNIKKVAKLIHRIYEERLSKGHHSEIKFIIECFNDSQITSKDISIFRDNSALQTRLIRSITISYSSYDKNEKIDIQIFHGNNVYKNTAVVKSPDSVWVNDVTNKIEQSLQNDNSFSNLVTDYQNTLKYITALSFGLLCLTVLEFAVNRLPMENFLDVPIWFYEPYYTLPPVIYWVSKYALAFIVGVKFASKITHKLVSLYPLINLQTGSQNQHMETERMKVLMITVLVWATPVLMTGIRIIAK